MTKTELQNLVVNYAYGYGIDPQIALAQARQESGFNPLAVSSAGARGLMQFMPGTWARFGQGDFDNAFDPDYNLTAWGNYLTWLLGRYNWDYRKALAGYYGGEGRVDKGTVTAGIWNYADGILSNAGVMTVAGNADGNLFGDQDSGIFWHLLVVGGVIALAVILKR